MGPIRLLFLRRTWMLEWLKGKQNSMQFGQENRERETKFMPTLASAQLICPSPSCWKKKELIFVRWMVDSSWNHVTYCIFSPLFGCGDATATPNGRFVSWYAASRQQTTSPVPFHRKASSSVPSKSCEAMRLRASTLTAQHWYDQAMSTSHKRQRQSITVSLATWKFRYLSRKIFLYLVTITVRITGMIL